MSDNVISETDRLIPRDPLNIPAGSIIPEVQRRLRYYDGFIKELYSFFNQDKILTNPDHFRSQMEFFSLDLMNDALFIAKAKLAPGCNLPTVAAALDTFSQYLSKAQSSMWFFSRSGIR